jgi:hypothetical protein
MGSSESDLIRYCDPVSPDLFVIKKEQDKRIIQDRQDLYKQMIFYLLLGPNLVDRLVIAPINEIRSQLGVLGQKLENYSLQG